MEITQKVKIALDETRMLILGAQILLGFQLRGVFSDGYDQLPTHVRYLDGLGLMLMICVVGLLITPGPYHRIVGGGEDSEDLHRLATAIAELALFPFALALGIDIVITTGRIFGELVCAVAGIAATAVAIGFWYGFPQLRKRRIGEQERAMTTGQIENTVKHASSCEDRADANRGKSRSARRSGPVRLSTRHRPHPGVRAAPERIENDTRG